MTPLEIGFLASHGGTSMRAIVAAIAAGELAARARIVICNNADAPALEFARMQQIPFRHISARTEGGETEADAAICSALDAAGAEWVVMSGYLRKLGPQTLQRYRGRILNIHPALLPKFGGQGMYGRHVHEAVIAAGEAVSGATVHLVDEEYDHGEIIAQHTVPVRPGDTVEDLQSRITAAEPGLFVDVLKSLAGRG
ncbi:MAG: phosphoribosylglycinamide formyltransferase [Xanthobacteraceae bacterium]|nr:phosphoribosylglycinamide formyltransferase [Xanthobacteraceae bacterium]